MKNFCKVLCVLTVAFFMNTLFQSCDNEGEEENIDVEEKMTTIDFSHLGVQYIDTYFGPGSTEGVLFRIFAFKINPPIAGSNGTINGKVVFKEAVPFEYFKSLVHENYGYDAETGELQYGDKWYFKDRVSGQNALKIIVDLDDDKSAESDWVYFRYDWSEGITLIKSE